MQGLSIIFQDTVPAELVPGMCEAGAMLDFLARKASGVPLQGRETVFVLASREGDSWVMTACLGPTDLLRRRLDAFARDSALERTADAIIAEGDVLSPSKGEGKS